MLTSAVEAKTMEGIASRQDAEKTRQVGGKLVDATNQLSDQVEELRRVMQDMSNQIARSR
jgi:methyl-accepting chemotaxis protein